VCKGCVDHCIVISSKHLARVEASRKGQYKEYNNIERIGMHAKDKDNEVKRKRGKYD
jgi:hypothetical protein